MNDECVLDGDLLQFDSQFGNRTVIPTGPMMIRGTGHATINQRHVCVVGDETKVQIPATYTSANFTIPGAGTLTIASLGADQQVPTCKSNAALIVKGQQFTARFTGSSPAQDPSGPSPDPSYLTPTMGTGSFITTQMWVKAK